MLGKGAKRKLDEDEEGLEGEALASPVASPAGEPVRGPEGLSVPEGLSKVSYTLQRQTIFNISLMKLYSQRPLTEPSLERRVLINNMLRRIQNELKQEGSLRPLLLPPSPPPDDPMDEGFREAPPSSFGALSSVAAAGGVAVQPSNQPQSGLLMPVLAPPSPHPLAPPATCLSSQPSAAPLLETCLTPASLLEEDGDSAFCASSSLPPTPPLSPPPPPPALPPSALTPLPPAPLSSLLLGQGSPREPTPASSNDGFPSTPTDMELDPPTAILSRTVSAAALTSATSTTTTSPGPSPLAQTPPLVPLPPSLTTAAGHPRDGSARTIGTPRPEVHGVVSTLEVRPMDVLPAHVPVHAPVPTSGLADITSPSLPSSPPSSSPSAGFLSDLALDDILFADIDTSMYDFDPCTTSGATGAATTAAAAGGTLGVVTATAAGVAVGAGPGSGLSKLSPVVTADDLLKSLACPYGGPAQQVSANQPFKIDLTELDHIMEVLVGS